MRGRYFTLHVRPSELDTARLGLVVAKKLARRAVLRNLIKRLARESFRLRRTALPRCDIVVRLTASPRDATRKALREELEQLLGKVRA
ncbi:MAG: ribonuclease P protein component [Rhodocyclaceae bacterium]|nr:ribonuclease P protein component [Rhodocyclaceae bacterium]